MKRFPLRRVAVIGTDHIRVGRVLYVEHCSIDYTLDVLQPTIDDVAFIDNGEVMPVAQSSQTWSRVLFYPKAKPLGSIRKLFAHIVRPGSADRRVAVIAQLLWAAINVFLVLGLVFVIISSVVEIGRIIGQRIVVLITKPSLKLSLDRGIFKKIDVLTHRSI